MSGVLGCAWPENPAVSNLDLLSRHPDTAGRPAAMLEELARRVAKTYGFDKRHLTHWPGTPLTGAEETSESLALRAAKDALSGNSPEAFVLGSTTSRRYTGSQATSVLGKLDICAPAFEIKAGCSTSLASLHFAQALLAQGYDNVLVSCAETLSKVINPAVRETWFGMADGAAAVWLERAKSGGQLEIVKSVYSTDGRHVDMYTTHGDLPPRAEALASGGYFLSGDSAELKDLAKARYLEMINALLPTAEERKAIRWHIPHQVNLALVEEVRAETGLGGEVVWSAKRVRKPRRSLGAVLGGTGARGETIQAGGSDLFDECRWRAFVRGATLEVDWVNFQ